MSNPLSLPPLSRLNKRLSDSGNHSGEDFPCSVTPLPTPTQQQTQNFHLQQQHHHQQPQQRKPHQSHHPTHISNSFSSISPQNSSEDELSLLKKRNAELEQENEQLKASLFLLSQKLSTRSKSEGSVSLHTLFSSSSVVADPVMPSAPLPPLPPPPALLIPSVASGLSSPTAAPQQSPPYLSSNNLAPSNSSRLMSFSTQESLPSPILTCESTLEGGHQSAIYATKFSPFDNLTLVSTSLDRQVLVWTPNTENGFAFTRIGLHEESGTDVQFLQPHLVLSSSMDRTVRVWDVSATTSNQPAAVVSFSTDGIPLCLTAMDANVFLAGTSLGVMHLFDMRTPSTVISQRQDTSPATARLNALCHGDFGVVSGDSLGSLRHWDLRQLTYSEDLLPVKTAAGNVSSRASICGLSVDASNRFLAVYSHDNCVRVYSRRQDAGTLRLVQSVKGAHRSRDWPVRLSFSKPGDSSTLLAVGSTKLGGSAVFGTKNPATEELAFVQKLDGGHTDTVYECDFSANHTHLATCSGDATIKVWRRE